MYIELFYIYLLNQDVNLHQFYVQFVKNWLTIVLGEREKEGIDFWWLDWQQG